MAEAQTHSCPDCDERFDSFNKLKSHMYSEHGRAVSKAMLYGTQRPVEETKWYTCDHCGERFQGLTNYSKHQREMRRAVEQEEDLERRAQIRRREARIEERRREEAIQAQQRVVMERQAQAVRHERAPPRPRQTDWKGGAILLGLVAAPFIVEAIQRAAARK